MAQLSVSWFICDGRFRVHAINAVGRRSGRIIEIEDIDTGERVHGSSRGHPGPLATKALVAFIAGRPVSCHQVDYDHKNNRPVAVCFAGNDDLQALMVSAGWAWAYTAFSDQYVDAERRAAARGVGLPSGRPPRLAAARAVSAPQLTRGTKSQCGSQLLLVHWPERPQHSKWRSFQR
jgi:endonuclease YncB( thermonuclease family)